MDYGGYPVFQWKLREQHEQHEQQRRRQRKQEKSLQSSTSSSSSLSVLPCGVMKTTNGVWLTEPCGRTSKTSSSAPGVEYYSNPYYPRELLPRRLIQNEEALAEKEEEEFDDKEEAVAEAATTEEEEEEERWMATTTTTTKTSQLDYPFWLGLTTNNGRRRNWFTCLALVFFLPTTFYLGFTVGRAVPMGIGVGVGGTSTTHETDPIGMAVSNNDDDDDGYDYDEEQTSMVWQDDDEHVDDQNLIAPSPVSSNTLAPTSAPPTPLPSLSPLPMLPAPTSAPTIPLTPPPVSPPVPWSSTHRLQAGPLVGHTTHRSTTIWAFRGGGKESQKQQHEGEMQLMYRTFSVNGVVIATTFVPMKPNPQANGAAVVKLDGLTPSTAYEYEIRINNEVVAEGRFRTAPPPNQPTKFHYLLASCMDVKGSKGYAEQPVWEVALGKKRQQQQQQQELDFALLAGDTVYLTEQDWNNHTGEVLYDRVWFRNTQQRREPHFAKLIRSVPTYATWDDHDYGHNDADHRQPGKETSLRAFQHLWPNPSSGTPGVPGMFFSYHWGNVQILVMDNRWYRDRNKGTQFGAAQKEWLFQQLISSQAVFKIIVTGSDVMERKFSADVDDIGKVVTEHGISGVLFNAGDIHRNEFKAFENDYWPYKVTQITSSGIAREWRRPFAIVSVDTTAATAGATNDEPTITAYFYGADSESRLHNTTWSNDPTLVCSDIQGTDRFLEHRCTETIRLSDLTATSAPTANPFSKN